MLCLLLWVCERLADELGLDYEWHMDTAHYFSDFSSEDLKQTVYLILTYNIYHHFDYLCRRVGRPPWATLGRNRLAESNTPLHSP